MVATKYPYGAIDERLVAFIMFQDATKKYFIFDTGGNRIEVEQTVYQNLKEKGVREK